MTIVFKLSACAVITVFASLILKRELPEYASLVQVAGVCVAGTVILSYVPLLTSFLSSLFLFSDTDEKYLTILVKSAGTAIIAEIAASFCRDNGSSALAAGIETSARAVILLMCVPMIKSIALIASSLIGR